MLALSVGLRLGKSLALRVGARPPTPVPTLFLLQVPSPALQNLAGAAVRQPLISLLTAFTGAHPPLIGSEPAADGQ